MARPPRVDAPGAAFFVTTVTHGRSPHFTRPGLARATLEVLADERSTGRFELFAYVLMPDHAHLILRPEFGSLSDAMRRWKSLSWRRCRDDHGLVGKLWQESFFDEGVHSVRQLRSQIGYVHRNPVRAGLVEGPEEWPWSSFGWFVDREAPVEIDPIEV